MTAAGRSSDRQTSKPARSSRPEDAGLALDQLSTAFAQMLEAGSDPYTADLPEAAPDEDHEQPGVSTPSAAAGSIDEGHGISPKSILEAMLFVGNAGNEGLTSRQVAGLMRGVRPAEIDALARELNAEYEARGCPYEVVSDGPGYRLALRAEFQRTCDKLPGKGRQARLSQPAIEVLSAVAYGEPLTAEDVNKLRGAPSGHLLAQLVRRQLLRLERSGRKGGKYFTTQRFLDLFGLKSLDELPHSEEPSAGE